MKRAFLFPGQGAQTVGMGKDLYDTYTVYKQTFDACIEGTGLDLKQACFDGFRMDEGEVTQPAIFAHSISLFALLESKGVKADICAGLSLGEYGALCAAGVFGVAQCAALVRERGRIMDAAFPVGAGGMLSVVGFTAAQIEDTIKDAGGVYLANHLAELSAVIAGKTEDIEKLKPVFEQMGAKMVTPLAVRGPSHAPLLDDASKAFAQVLSSQELGEMTCTVYANALGKPYDKDSDVRALLAEQMRARVRWHGCIEHMIASGVDSFLEVGPSNVLTKMLKRRVDKDTQIASVRDAKTFEKFIETAGIIT